MKPSIIIFHAQRDEQRGSSRPLKRHCVRVKKFYFSGLISCGLVLTAAQTTGQNTRPDTSLAAGAATVHPPLYATIRNDDANQNVVILHWSTHDVTDVDRYVIEKSTDSILFNPLHEVIPGKAADAMADSIYRDEDPFPVDQSNYSGGTNFYRLATIYKDGNKLYSPVVRVNVNGAQTPLLRPVLLNVNGSLRMDNFYKQPLIVDLYDQGGGHIASYAANSDSFNINTAGLSRGTIIYRISDEHHAFLNAGKIQVQ